MRDDCGCSDDPTRVKLFSKYPLELLRAAGISARSSSIQLTDESPMILELAPPAQSNVNAHWVIEHLSVVVTCTERPPSYGTPINGLFLVPPGSAPGENLAIAQSAAGVTMQARPIVLPLVERAVPSETLPNGNFYVDMTLHPGFKATCPGNAGWKIRAILNCAPCTASPGPGVNSIGFLMGTFYLEVNPT